MEICFQFSSRTVHLPIAQNCLFCYFALWDDFRLIFCSFTLDKKKEVKGVFSLIRLCPCSFSEIHLRSLPHLYLKCLLFYHLLSLSYPLSLDSILFLVTVSIPQTLIQISIIPISPHWKHSSSVQSCQSTSESVLLATLHSSYSCLWYPTLPKTVLKPLKNFHYPQFTFLPHKNLFMALKILKSILCSGLSCKHALR